MMEPLSPEKPKRGRWRVPRLSDIAGHVKQRLRDKLVEHRHYVDRHGEDMPEVRDWQWEAAR